MNSQSVSQIPGVIFHQFLFLIHIPSLMSPLENVQSCITSPISQVATTKFHIPSLISTSKVPYTNTNSHKLREGFTKLNWRIFLLLPSVQTWEHLRKTLYLGWVPKFEKYPKFCSTFTFKINVTLSDIRLSICLSHLVLWINNIYPSYLLFSNSSPIQSEA